MSGDKVIFDRKLLRNRRVFLEKDFPTHNFLYHEIANYLVEDVADLNQQFGSCLEITARDNYLAKQIFEKKLAKKILTTDLVRNSSNIICDDEFLPFKNQTFDLVLSNLNMHHINLMPQFLMQIKALLKQNGIFIASFFGEENLRELHETVFNTENQLYQGVSPRMIPTIDVKTAAILLQKAGLHNPISSLQRIEVKYKDVRNLLKDLKLMGQGNIINMRSKRFFTKEFLDLLVKNYHEKFGDENGEASATFEIITVIGTKN